MKWFLKKDVEDEMEDADDEYGFVVGTDTLTSDGSKGGVIEDNNCDTTNAEQYGRPIDIKLQQPMKQVRVTTSWEVGSGKRSPRKAKLNLWLHPRLWTCSKTNNKVDPWAPKNEEVLRRIMGMPNLFKGMNILL